MQRLGLAAGRRWDDEIAAAVQHAVELQKARAEAFARLSRAASTRSELRERLQQRGHSPAVIDQALDELVADGWIDDEAAARQIGEAALRRGPQGSAALAARLRRRGVEAEAAANVAGDLLADHDVLGDALKLARRQLKSMTGRDQRTQARRVAATLARRGYDEDIVMSVLEALGLLDERD